MATIENNFKVKNGLIVSNTASILSTDSNALTVSGGTNIRGNLTVGGALQVNGTVTSIESTSVDIGTNVIYLSTLSNLSALQAVGSGIVVGTDPNNTTNTQTWISLTFDGYSNWISNGGIYPTTNNFYGLGSNNNVWSSIYTKTVVVKGMTTTTNGLIFVDASNTLQATTATWNSSTGQIQGSITTATTATYSGNLLGGAVASLPYQININQTGMLPLGIEGQVLAVGTGTVYWASLSGVTVSTATNFSGGGPGAIPFQQSSGQTAYDDIYFRYSYSGSTGSLLVTQNIAVQSGSSATSQVTGALQVTGGVGVTGSIYAGIIYSNGNAVLTGSGTSTGYVTSITAGTDISVNTNTGAVTVSDISTFQSVTNRGNTTTNIINIINTSTSFSTQSGALIVTGGVGIGGTVYAGTIYSNGNQVLTSGGAGSGYVSSITAGTDTAVTTSTGNVIVYSTATLQSIVGRNNITTYPIYAGGLYDDNNRVVTSVVPSGSTYIGVSNVISTGTATSFTISNLGVQTLTAGTDTVVTTSTGSVIVYSTSTLQSVSNRGATTNNAISITNSTVSSNTTTGALIVTGGVGIGQNLNIGGNFRSTGTIQHNGLLLTSGTNIDQIYTTSTTLTLNTNWQNTGVYDGDLPTGSYIVQCLANDSAQGGGEVNTYYTGVMSWYSAVDSDSSYDEITLHRAGAASGAGAIFLQVLRTNGGYMALQIAGDTTNTGSSTYTFSFRRMI